MKQPVEQNPSAYTSLSSLGEFRLIEHLTRDFQFLDERVIKGPGDDAAVIYGGKDKVHVVSTDLLLEGIHFDLAYVPLHLLGYKAIVVNLSDIVAMNAEPYGVTVSIGMSSRFPVEAVEEIYKGIKAACDQYQVTLLGGDTTSSQQGLILSVTAMGEGKEEEMVYRNGAKENDLICVTGDIGGAYAGFLVLDREKAVYLKSPDLQPNLTDYEYVVGRQLKPEARLDVIRTLKQQGVQPTSMMDISDGLASELHHICHQSQKGCTIYANKLPIDWQTNKVGEEFEIGPVTFALNGGEDYELLFTVPLEDFKKVSAIKDISVIGKITEDRDVLQVLLESGQSVDLEAQGWQHFKKD
ncbi:MAG: thiamine-phosphate kinase [Bacteroidota bacterium]